MKSGQPGVLPASSVLRWGVYEQHGVAIYISVGMMGTRHAPQQVYVPVRPGCVFQTYNLAAGS